MLVITVPVISTMVTKVILCMLVISATFGKLLHSEFDSTNTRFPPTFNSNVRFIRFSN